MRRNIIPGGRLRDEGLDLGEVVLAGAGLLADLGRQGREHGAVQLLALVGSTLMGPPRK